MAAEKRDVASAAPSAPAETKDAAPPAAPPAPAEKKEEAASAEPPAPAVKKDTPSAAPPAAPAEKTKETALPTPPATTPQPPAEVESATPPPASQSPPPAAEKPDPALETKPKADAPQKVEPSPPKVEDLALCRSDLMKLAAANPVHFARGSSTIDPSAVKALESLARAIMACPGVHIAVEGHTDIEGNEAYNHRLSRKRAEAVADLLIRAGVPADEVRKAGFGTSRPVAPNTSRLNRAKNRRAEIVVRP